MEFRIGGHASVEFRVGGHARWLWPPIVVKILSRISVGGISMVSVCRRRSSRAVVDGSLDLSARATSSTSFFI